MALNTARVRRAQEDFGVQQDDLYAIVADWTEHTAGVEALVELQEELGTDATGAAEAVRGWAARRREADALCALRADTGLDAGALRKVRARAYLRGPAACLSFWTLGCPVRIHRACTAPAELSVSPRALHRLVSRSALMSMELRMSVRSGHPF